MHQAMQKSQTIRGTGTYGKQNIQESFHYAPDLILSRRHGAHICHVPLRQVIARDPMYLRDGLLERQDHEKIHEQRDDQRQ